MLTTSKEMVFKARASKYAIGCFNTCDLEITKAIIAAAENQKSPVIIATTPKAIEYAGLDTLAALIKKGAEKSKIPIALHLDHGLTLTMVEKSLEAGYTSVMFDGSGSELTHNEILTRQAVEMAHTKNVPCEGELGHLGKASTPQKDKNQDFSANLSATKPLLLSQLTNPDDVIEFVQTTGIDFLAVSIGSQHGVGRNETLDIKLLEKINSITGVPLVLHGGSGVPASSIRKAIENGIAKINIDTDIRHEFTQSLKQILAKCPQEKDFREILKRVIVDIQKLVEEKIKLFGSNNKA